MPFKYNERTNEEWFMIPLFNGSVISRAGIQDYARCMNVTEDRWMEDAVVWFMHECDRQGAHGQMELKPADPLAGYTKRAPWRINLSERLHGLADKVVGLEDV